MGSFACMYVCAAHMYRACKVQKRVVYPLGRDLQTVVSCTVGTGN